MKKKGSIVVAILLLAVGFAAISTTLIINGSTKVSENADDFSVIFTKATLDGTDVYANVIDDTKKIITFETNDLKTLNQTSVLNYEVTNNSANYDAEVTINCKVKDDATAKYTSIKNELEGNATKVLAKETLNGTLTITLNKTATEEVKEEYVCTLEFNAVERDELGGSKPVSFATDSWATIQKAVQTGNTSKYNVGDTKTVTLASHTNDCSTYNGKNGASYACNSSVEPEKELTVRIANKSECTNGETSETACGFVVEFVDIIANHNYNISDATNKYGTNVGGWRDSKLRTYVNEAVYNALPNDLQNVIATTKVISSHGSTEETNFETQDKLYLLSVEEIFSDSSTGYGRNDTSVGTSKQLDYYKNKGVTTTDKNEAIKQYGGIASPWWTRTASSSTSYYSLNIYSNGSLDYRIVYDPTGVSPAFRIA